MTSAFVDPMSRKRTGGTTRSALQSQTSCAGTLYLSRERGTLQLSCFSFESPVPIDEFVKEFPPRSWRGEFRHTFDWLVALTSRLTQHIYAVSWHINVFRNKYIKDSQCTLGLFPQTLASKFYWLSGAPLYRRCTR